MNARLGLVVIMAALVCAVSPAAAVLGAVGASATLAAVPGPLHAQPALGPALPAFAVSARSPAYTLNSNCSTGGGAITFHLTVSNNGLGPSAAITQDQGVKNAHIDVTYFP